MELFIFLTVSIIAIVAAVLMITQKQPVHSAMLLILVFFCLAILYLLLGAQFIAAIQIIVYTGAIMTLFLFVIMHMRVSSPALTEKRPFQLNMWGYIFAGLILILMISVVISGLKLGVKGEITSEIIQKVGQTESFAQVLFTKYLLPFELTSILLLVAIIGAIILTRKKTD